MEGLLNFHYNINFVAEDFEVFAEEVVHCLLGIGIILVIYTGINFVN